MIEMNIKGLMVIPYNMPIIILRTGARRYRSACSSQCVRSRSKTSNARPMTRPAAQHPGPAFGVDRIVVCDLKENTFYALIHFRPPPDRSPSTRGRAIRSPWRCARADHG
jgi:hypothetical protein